MLDEVAAAAWDEHIDASAGGHQLRGALTAEGVDGLDRVHRHGGGRQRLADDCQQRLVGGLCGRSAAQNGGVSGFDRQGGDVHRHVGSGLVDGAHDAQGDGDLAQAQPVGQGPALQHLAHRVLQAHDLLHRGSQLLDPLLGQLQPVLHGGRQSVLLSAVEVLLVGSDQGVSRFAQAGGDGRQRLVFVAAVQGGQRSGRCPGAAADLGDRAAGLRRHCPCGFCGHKETSTFKPPLSPCHQYGSPGADTQRRTPRPARRCCAAASAEAQPR